MKRSDGATRRGRQPAKVALCPCCGEALPVYGPCPHCGYDPSAFSWVTPQGGARMERDFVWGLLRLLRQRMRRWRR